MDARGIIADGATEDAQTNDHVILPSPATNLTGVNFSALDAGKIKITFAPGFGATSATTQLTLTPAQARTFIQSLHDHAVGGGIPTGDSPTVQSLLAGKFPSIGASGQYENEPTFLGPIKLVTTQNEAKGAQGDDAKAAFILVGILFIVLGFWALMSVNCCQKALGTPAFCKRYDVRQYCFNCHCDKCCASVCGSGSVLGKSIKDEFAGASGDPDSGVDTDGDNIPTDPKARAEKIVKELGLGNDENTDLVEALQVLEGQAATTGEGRLTK